MAADPAKLKETKRIGRSGALFSMARVPDSGRVFFGSSDFKVYDVDLAAEKPEPKEMTGHNSYVTGMALAGEFVISGSYDRQLIWWKRDSREQVRKVKAHDKWIRKVVASPDGKIIASVADDMVCRLWDSRSGKPLRELRGHQPTTPTHFRSMLFTCAFSPDGKLLATADKVGHVVVWEVATGKQARTFESPDHYTWDPKQRRHSIGGVRSLEFSPDGKLLAVGGIGKIGNVDHLGGKALVQIYDWQKGERTHDLRHDKHKGLVEQLRFHHNNDWLLAAGGAHGGFLLFIDLKQKKFIGDLDAKMHVHAMDLNKKSDTIYAVGQGSIVKWEMK